MGLCNFTDDGIAVGSAAFIGGALSSLNPSLVASIGSTSFPLFLELGLVSAISGVIVVASIYGIQELHQNMKCSQAVKKITAIALTLILGLGLIAAIYLAPPAVDLAVVLGVFAGL